MLKIRVETRNPRGDVESIKDIDHDDRNDRVWLGKHCFWALRSGREIRTYAVSVS